jgi:hypothetical protein
VVKINAIAELDTELEEAAEQWIVAIIEGQDDTFFKKRFESVNKKYIDSAVKISTEALTESLEYQEQIRIPFQIHSRNNPKDQLSSEVDLIGIKMYKFSGKP